MTDTTTTKKPRKAPVRSTKPALKWKKLDDGGLVAVADEVTYTVKRSGDKFAAVVKKGAGKPQTLKDGISDGQAYALLRKVYAEA